MKKAQSFQKTGCRAVTKSFRNFIGSNHLHIIVINDEGEQILDLGVQDASKFMTGQPAEVTFVETRYEKC